MPKKKFTEVDFEMFVMPWGQYANKTFDEIPAGYLLFIAEEKYAPEILKTYVDENYDDLAQDAADEQVEYEEEQDLRGYK